LPGKFAGFRYPVRHASNMAHNAALIFWFMVFYRGNASCFLEISLMLQR